MSVAWAATKTTGQENSGLWLIFVEGFLDWPFLGFLLIVGSLWFYRAEIAHLLKNRGITINIAGNTVTVSEAVESINEETEKKLLAFQEQLQTLETKVETLIPADGEPQATDNFREGAQARVAMGAEANPEDRAAAIWTRLRRELLEGKFVWRTIDRLALVAGITPEYVHEVLATQPDEVKIGRSKSGRTIARHVTREPLR